MRSTLKLLKRASSKGAGVLRRLSGEDSGVSAMELALIAPFLGAMLIGVIDFGTAFTRQMALANAVRAGTQYAMIRRPVGEDISEIFDQVDTHAPAAPTNGSRVLNVVMVCECSDTGSTAANCDPATDCAGVDVEHFVQIRLTENFPLILNYPWISNPVALGDDALIRLN